MFLLSPPFFADERHEGEVIGSRFYHLIALSVENTHLLSFGVADGNNQPPVISKLLEKRTRHVGRACCYKNGVKRLHCRPAERAIAQSCFYFDSKLFKSFFLLARRAFLAVQLYKRGSRARKESPLDSLNLFRFLKPLRRSCNVRQ